MVGNDFVRQIFRINIKMIGLISLVFLSLPLLNGQINYVPNPGFEDVSDCDLEYGDADKATPWKIVDEDITSPDLYHACSTGPFYGLPGGGCFPVFPKSGDGMVGLVNLVAEERIYARLTDDLPTDVDIYVAYSIIPSKKCGTPMESICYSNTQSLAFSNIQFESREVVLELENVLDEAEEWTQLQSCYQATGEEKLVLIGNYKLTSQTLTDCDYIDPNGNFAYFYVDDIIVSPFDVVPDTLFICGDEVLEIDASFYEVPIEWSDGVLGSFRNFTEGGSYVAMGDVGDCFLMDTTIVIKIEDDPEIRTVDLCNGGEVRLFSPVPAIWPNGETSRSQLVRSAGSYIARLLSPCGERIIEFLVEEKSCEIQYFVPNIFSPNDDGINDQLEFFFKSEFEFNGELSIFDRWGNLLLNEKNVNDMNPIRWDGIFKGRNLDPSVYVWIFKYESTQDGKTRIIHGDITLLR